MEEEEYEEVVEYYIEETTIEEGEPYEVVTEITETVSTDFTGPKTTTYTVEREKSVEHDKSVEHEKSVEDAAPPVRKKTIRTKVDPSKFLTPYLQHSNKMKDLFSENKYKEKFRKERGKPYASTVDTPEIRRIKKVQDQLSEVKYRMAGEVAKTICHVDEKAMDIEHAKKVSQQVSKVLYKQNWEENKDKYLLPPDAPELVNAIKNTAMFSKKLYTEDWEGDKTLFYPYNDSPELRRVAQAQKTLSDIVYKKGHDERKSKYTPLPDPPDVEQAKKVTRQLSDIIYHEDYKNKIKGKWTQTPCYDVAIAKMNAENLSMRKYQEDFENMKDQIYFMQTETPEYEANKRVSNNVSKVKYRADYEKNKAIADYNVLPATENPLLKQLKAAGNALSDKLYKEAYEQSKGTSINYCDTPKFQTDSVLKNFSDVKYKDAYQKNILGHYVGSFEDPHQIHCMKVEAMKSDKNYKAEYEEEKTRCYFPQTITQEYEAIKKLEQCKDHTYKKHPDQTKFTQVTDSPVQKQAEINSKQLSDIIYKSKGEEIIHKYHLPPDVPQFIQAKVNAYNISDNYYKMGLEELKSKGYDLKSDAIPIQAAKAARQAVSDVNYKKAYELTKGKLVGFRSIQDDPKLVHSMKVAKMQSEREYKKDYEKTKTKYNIPLDMVNVVGAKKAQEIASNTNYKNLFHHYTYLPDAMNVELSKNMMEIQSDNVYKADYNNWMKGIGWVPIGSLEVEKAKKAGDALNEKKYRQHPDTIKFTSVVDSPVMVQAKQNSVQLNDKLYRSSGEEVKHKYTLSPDIPQFIQARYNAANISDAYYKQGYHDLIAKGNKVSLDAIPITLAKASRNIASDYKYKESYEKAKGKQVGFRSLQDDPKLVHYMNVAKIQSEREYKKDYEKTKTNYHATPDMYSIQAAKQSQDVASNAHYKKLIHHYTYLPDAMDVELAKNMMQIQSDNAYKQDYNSWFKGIGWSPLGSLDVEKAKKAGEALNEKKYRQHPDTIKFTSIPDSMPMVLAQHNTKQLSDVTYKQEGEKLKHKYTLDPDVPQFIQARVNAYNLSDANYKADWKKTIAKGYDLKPDAIPIIAAKASRNIASDYKYKESYEKGKGKQVGYRSLQDDPKLVHYMNVAKMQSDREYKKDYEVTKTKYHTPLDMFSVTAAKKAQEVITNTGYKQPIHNYTLLPDSVNLELSRNVMQIQSDNVYKSDFNNWLRGVGWVPIQSLDVEKAKKATEILSEKKYRQHPDKLKYSITMDAMEQVLAKQNAKTMNKRLYTDKWNQEKTSIHVMPDTPEILQSRVNQITMSNKLYKAGWEEDKKKGYDLQPDAIPIKAAKASRDIASDYKYKLAYEKAKGKHIGFRSLEDDPKLVHFMQVAKMQSDREYKKDYEKAKTNFHTPVDMFSVVAAKKAQEVATNVNYKNLIHTYSVLPDAMSLELAKTMMQIQSDNQYRAEYDESMKGVGWVPLGSLEAEKNKKAMEILSEKKYRQHPDKLKYSVPLDSMNMALALNNAKIMNEHKYKQAWEEDKRKVHITPDVPQIALAKVNAFNLSDKMYRLSFEESRKKGYDLRADAIPIKAAKASRDIASDYKYKLGYEQDKGKLVGFRSLQDDPKLVHYMQVAKMQSDREYKKGYEASKTHYHTPSDTLSIVAAKEAQDRITNTNYKRLIHKYMLLPDAMSLELYRNMNQIQSDNEYKQEYNEYFKGIGWSPAGSLDVEKSKKAMEIASDQKYRQHPSMFHFTKQNDSMDMVLAKQNANIMNKHAYTEAWEKDKIQVHVMPDTPDILQAKQNKANYSQKLYRLGWEQMIKKGYDLTPEAISVKTAKASRDIASDYKYKEGYRKQQGHHIGFRSLQDDPKMLWSMQVAKMQSEREYKKDFEKWKTKFNMPVDMLGFLLAKKCQELVSDVDYKRVLHRWTCLPDQIDVEQAKRVYELQSDNVYKSDLTWLRGIGWSPIGSLDEEKNKRASLILSDKKYRQHPDTIKFTSLPDSMPMVLAKHNSEIMNQRAYTSAWEKDKTSIHIMPDTPGILLAQQNKVNYSEKLYRLAMEEDKKKGYDMRADAIPITSAKASRDIASDYKYKEGYRKQLGHHIGARNIEDDPKMMWSMHVAKIQSDREYKKAFEKTKTHFSSPVDMLGIVLAKKCQELVSDVDYKHPLHRWTCLPDQNDVVQARKVYDLQSDNVYKSDLTWLRGIGWSPIGSLDEEKNKRASLILSDKKYRQHPDTIKFTSLPDSMPMVLAKHNSEIMNQRAYTSAWEKDKTSIHIMPDTPGILLAQQNKVNYSEKLYRLAMEEDKKKGYDMRADAIPITSAKASRDIASDYKYKEGYRKQLGHHIGARNIEDDPKMMWSMHVAKIQSDREYKKAFEKTKTHFSSPVDMLGIVLAKKCQELVSDVDYKHPLHRWTCLPDQNDVVQARKVYDLQSDNVYKSDLTWLRGIGWSPIGSLDEEKNKRASLILSDKKYRQHPDTIKFTSLPDSMPMVLAKHNSEIMNQRAYTSAWEKDKTSIHIMPDTPGILLAQQNKVNYSEKLYRLAMEEDKKKGYDMRADAIPITSAKASRDIASDYKYKEGYRKQLGHHIGARNIEDDPKMMWSMHVAKIQSDREYKKAFEKTKTHFSSPVDMLGIVLAKKCQGLVSDIDYRHYLHQWICLPDQNDVIHARQAYDLQSDNCYKSDLQWLRGIGWVPIGSLEVEKAKKAGEILSDKVYRQPPDTIKFTSIPDSVPMVLAKQNAETMNKRLYTEAWDKDKIQIHVMPDTPEIILAKQNMQNYSVKLYKQAMEEDKKKGYDLRSDAIPIQAAKASRQIASDYKYKEGYRKQLGHHIGARNIEDDPKMVWSMHVAKIQSDREYKKAFEKTKTHFSSPVDMLGIVLAKKCQGLVSDIDYRHYLHQWICLPDQNDVIHARQAYDLQSDNCYKSDLQWLRGIGWVPIGSPEVEKAKKAAEILSDKVYRQPPDTIKFTSIPDSVPMVLAKQNAETLNKHLYTEAWNKDKTMIHVMPDTPEILLAKQNQINYSQKMYRLALEESKKKGHDLRFDAIPIQSAKASREIASDYKYKEGYRKQLGHHIGARNIEDDPKMMWSMHVAKIQSDREYKKAFEKTKTHFSSPVDMLGIVLAKKCQGLVSDIDYRHYLHQWICLPDQNDVIHAKKAYDLQSDAVYKSDLEWLRGIGWVPIGSMEVEKAKKAGEILSERKYRQPADQIKFTSVTDSLAMVLAKQNAEIMNKRLYTEAWDADKTSIHVMPDTPSILLAKANAANVSHKLYIQAWEDAKKKGYDMRADAIPFRSAKASRDIASDYKYKETYEKQKGHYIGCKTAQEDPKLSWAARAMQLQNDRIYRKAYHDSKSQVHIPVDAMSVQAAKDCQTLVSDIDYRQYLHQWTCLPDQNDVIHARKAYDLQSDNVYKSDLEWLRGIGWLTEGSVDVVKAKKAQELLNERLYRTRPDEMKFTSITDSPDIVQAKINALQISDRLYRENWDRDKTQVSIPSDTPVMLQSKVNALNISNKHYQKAWDEAKAKSYDLRADAIPIKHAKASRDIASEYKYKETHEKQKGHYIGCKTAQEDPKLSWAARAMQLQNDRIYRKAYHDSKSQVHIPVDAMSVQAAKDCQTLVSDIDYRQYLHQWTCLPDQNDVIHARKAYDLQSDAVYKSDLEWLRGIGWLPNDSPVVKRVKHAQDLLSDNVYRTPIESLKYTSVVDSPDVLLAKANAEQVSIPKYKEAWEKDKTMIHIMADTPEINLAKTNAVNYSKKLYKEAWDEVKTNYDLRADAIPIKAAKASREIASDYKYKLDHEKQKGHYVGVPNAEADSKMQFALGIGKVQSELEYKRHFAKWKTQCHLPVDMLSIVSAKQGQSLVSDVDYRQYLHQWICLPDQNDVVQARKAYDLQSDAVYKSDLEWLRGIGWLPNDSLGINHVKYAGDLLNEKKYRTKPETLSFTPVADRVDYITAKNSGEIRSDIKYHKAWNEVKSNYTLTDTPQLDMAREAARILNQNLYKENWEKEKATGYLLPPDTVQICHAKHSNDVQSELKYKAEYVKQKGHYVGVASMRDDPKLVWFEHAGEIQNDRLYKSEYHKTKSKIHLPPDMVSVVAAKECQTLVSDIDYRQYLHEWTCHPDQNDCIQARKAYDLQSDNIYKSDLEWLRGCGWIPLDSVEHKKVKNAQELINKRAYTKEALDNFSNYTSVVDTPDIVLAKMNSVNQSDIKYKETFNLEKGQYIGSDDTPVLNHAKDMSLLYSDKRYKNAWEISKPIGYSLDEKYIPLVGAKHANYINSELKYKEIHEKLKGHYLAGKEIEDFPSVIHSLAFQKMRSALAYRKNYEDTKTNVHIPSDMMNHVLAKKCQYILSDLEYKTYFHQWNCSPEENDVIQAKRAQEILSDVVYKDDLNWLKGLGCYVWDTPQILQAKKSYDLQSQIKYTAAGKENFQNFGVVTDTPLYVTAVQSAINASDVKYKEDFHKTKDKYTTVTETVDSERVNNLKNLFSNNLYKKAWEIVKATSYAMPSDAVSLARAKELKHNASIVKYREEYDKFKALYTLPRGVEDDPNTARCLRVGKLNIDRLYKEVYEKTKAKIHIIPDMVDIISAKDAQKKISEVDYRTHLHDWICLPDLQINSHVRRVTDQVSDVIYKDDLNWLKGIGCFVWDTPEILHAKHAYDLRSDIKYKSKAEKMKNDYTVITDTPVYVQNVLSGLNLSEAVYRSEYLHNVKGKMIPTDKTVDLERAYHANKIQSENLYRWAGVNALPTGYSLPTDTPSFQHAKHVQYIGSDLKYKEAYEHMKAKGYTLGPKDVGFENVKKVNQVINERLYRATYHKYKDKIHTTPDTPEIRQVRATQEAVSDLIYKSDFFKMQGHLISLPYTPQVLHCRYVGDITSDNKYKEDLKWLKGLGCFLYDTPDMVRARQLRKLWSNYIYTDTAKKMWAKCNLVLDTPGYRAVQELKTHLSELVYRAAGKELKTKYTSILDTPDFLRAKQGQKIQSQYLYVELATKERPHHHADGQTPAFTHARNIKDMVSEKKYKTQYEKMKDKYTPVPDTPVLIRAKRAYLNASDLRYKETFENTKGKYHTVKDALNIVYHRKVTDDISSVKYKENFSKEMGKKPKYDLKEAKIYKTMKDAHNLASEVKYKADLKKLHKPVTDMSESLIMNHVLSTSQLASAYQYKKQYEKSKGHYLVVPDNLEQVHLREASELQSHVKYREKYEKEKGKPMLDFETPTYLTAKESQLMQSEKEYKKDFEENIKGRNLTGLEVTPSLLHVKYATKIASEKEYRKDLEEGVKGKGLTSLEETPDMLRAKNATQILNEKEYKKALELEIRGKGLTELALETPDFVRAKNATDIASQIKYKQLAEMEKANYTSVVDTPEIIHAQQVKNLSSQKKYKEDAEKSMPYYVPVADTPEIQRVRENQKNFSTLQYQWDLQNSKGKVTVVQDTPEMLRVKENQKNFSSILYKEDIGTGTTIEKTPEMQRVKRTQDAISSVKYKESIGKGTPIPDLPEVKRVKETQKHISSVLYKEDLGTGIPTPVTPEIERVKRNQEHISSVLYKEGLGTGIPTSVTPEMERVKRNQENISSVLYKEDLGTGTPTPVTPEIERVKRNQEHISSVLYKEDLGTGTPIPVTPELERVKRNQEHISSVLYKESVGTGTPTPITPEMERVKRNQEICSSVLYKENIGKATPTPVTPEMERVKRNQEIISSVLYKENVGKVTPTPITPEMERVKRNQEIISSVLYKENLGRATPTPLTPEMERVKRNQEHISSVVYKEGLGKATPTPVTPEMERVKRNQEQISSVLYKEHLAKGTPTPMTPEMERAKRNQENISSVLYSDSFRKQVQGKAAYVLDTPEMRRVRETQKNISTVKYHEEFEKSKGSFTPVVTDPITERVKKNMQDFSDISYRGIQRRVVEMERKRVDQDQETLTGLRVWRTNPGSVFDYDPAEDNIQSRSLHMISVQAQRRSREHSRSASALSLSGGDEKSEPSDGVDQHLSYYSSGGLFATTTVGYKHTKTIELPQQRSSSVATQQTTVSSVPSHPSTAGKTYRAMYDYMAADSDEVSFKDGDTIVNVQSIDEGWMYGTVQRTGKTGMLPANYVEAV
ncbi:nebulin isoform X17 [Pezoporus occidentalis]|uniref:nebulin isoform X17 n=1 Tax=Pezoporus occidentalis TaxID=407982 RepID=UPI002F916F81